MQVDTKKRKRAQDEEFDFDDFLIDCQLPDAAPPSLLPNTNELPLFQTTSNVYNIESVNIKLQLLEDAVVRNFKIIEQLLQEREQMMKQIAKAQEPKWNYLLKIQSASIFIRDKKSLKLIAVNDKGIELVKRQSAVNALPTMSAASKFLSSALLLLFLFKVNVVRSNVIKNVSFKVFLPYIGTLLQVYLHVEADFYWFETTEIVPPIYDDAFAIDELVSPATASSQVLLPIDNKALAFQLYLQASKPRDCQLLAHFLKRNDNKLVVDKQHLSQLIK